MDGKSLGRRAIDDDRAVDHPASWRGDPLSARSFGVNDAVDST